MQAVRYLGLALIIAFCVCVAVPKAFAGIPRLNAGTCNQNCDANNPSCECKR